MKKITITTFSFIAFAHLIGCAGVQTAPSSVTANEQIPTQNTTQTEKQPVSETNKKANDVSGLRGLPKDYQDMLGISNQEVILPTIHVEQQQAPAIPPTSTPTPTTDKK